MQAEGVRIVLQEVIKILLDGGSDDKSADLAREFEPTAQSIRNWVAVAGAKIGGREEKGSAPADADELVRLRREVRQLRQERDILSKAAAWFARETGTLPSGSSGS